MAIRQKYIPILATSIFGVLAAIIMISLRGNPTSNAAILCGSTGKTHTLAIYKDSFTPSTISVKRCDRIRVVNKDSTARLIALGVHDNHIDYPGFKEKSLGKGDGFTFTANVAGKYHMHDHVHDETEADIIIR